MMGSGDLTAIMAELIEERLKSYGQGSGREREEESSAIPAHQRSSGRKTTHQPGHRVSVFSHSNHAEISERISNPAESQTKEKVRKAEKAEQAHWTRRLGRDEACMGLSVPHSDAPNLVRFRL